jgi:hypothetical protein
MNGDPTAAMRRNVYCLLTVVAVAAVCARIVAIERVSEPSIHRAEPPPDPAAIVLPLAAINGLDTTVLVAAAGERWAWIDPNGPTRTWPHTRPTPSPTFSSNDRSRWAMVRALVDEGTFAIGRREYDSPGKYRDVGIVFEDGWQSIDKVLHPQTKIYYSSKPPLLPVMVAGEYWVLQKLFGWRIEKQTKTVVCVVLLTINALPFAIYLTVLARLIERYGRTDWGRLFTFAAACFATYLTTFANTFNNHTVAAYTTLFAVAPLLLGRTSAGGFATSGLFAGLTAVFELPAAAFLAALGVVALTIDWRRTLLCFAPAALIPIAAHLALNYAEIGDWKPAYEKIDSEWYRYEGSHWNAQGVNRRGIDYAGDQESRPTYAFHLLFGHHGLFSLTPIWLLSAAGLAGTLVKRPEQEPNWYKVHWATAAVSVIVIVFFAAIVSTVNYGGWTSGPRWFFWLTPLWLLAMIPVADKLGVSRLGRFIAYLFLALSIFSVSYVGINPWRHPWIYQAMEAWGWRGY